MKSISTASSGLEEYKKKVEHSLSGNVTVKRNVLRPFGSGCLQVGVVPIAGTPLVCLLFYHLSLQIPITNLCVDYVDPLDLLSRSLAGRHPLLCRASIRTLNGPRWARCKLGSDLKPRSITTVTDLGCWCCHLQLDL